MPNARTALDINILVGRISRNWNSSHLQDCNKVDHTEGLWKLFKQYKTFSLGLFFMILPPSFMITPFAQRKGTISVANLKIQANNLSCHEPIERPGGVAMKTTSNHDNIRYYFDSFPWINKYQFFEVII